MDTNESPETVDAVKEEILRAMRRGLNVTANASHIRDLAEAYAFLEGLDGAGAAPRTSPKKAVSPLVKQ